MTHNIPKEEICSLSESRFKNVYDSIKKAPQYPEGFKNVANGTRKVNIKNGDVLDELRKVESGQWKKYIKMVMMQMEGKYQFIIFRVNQEKFLM